MHVRVIAPVSGKTEKKTSISFDEKLEVKFKKISNFGQFWFGAQYFKYSFYLWSVCRWKENKPKYKKGIFLPKLHQFFIRLVHCLLGSFLMDKKLSYFCKIMILKLQNRFLATLYQNVYISCFTTAVFNVNKLFKIKTTYYLSK